MPNLKEIGIGILLLIVMSLILVIIFSDYVPTNVDVPTKVQAFELSEDIKEELKETVSQDEQNIVKTYFVDSSTLGTYEYKDNYNKGKVDPFATLSKTESNTTGTTSNSGSATTTQNGTSTTNNTSTQNSNTNNQTNTNNATNNNNQGSTNSNTNNTETNTQNSSSQGTFFNTGGKD